MENRPRKLPEIKPRVGVEMVIRKVFQVFDISMIDRRASWISGRNYRQ
jgi:hypothetical protein